MQLARLYKTCYDPWCAGPKLYEANWLDLTRDGHIANVQCSEVGCLFCILSQKWQKCYQRLVLHHDIIQNS